MFINFYSAKFDQFNKNLHFLNINISLSALYIHNKVHLNWHRLGHSFEYFYINMIKCINLCIFSKSYMYQLVPILLVSHWLFLFSVFKWCCIYVFVCLILMKYLHMYSSLSWFIINTKIIFDYSCFNSNLFM